jgi:hypothetical protein
MELMPLVDVARERLSRYCQSDCVCQSLMLHLDESTEETIEWQRKNDLLRRSAHRRRLVSSPDLERNDKTRAGELIGM